MDTIELFAGCGGAALGLHAAGMRHRALVELNADACATMRAAGLKSVVQGDVRDLDAIAKVAGNQCDLIWSSWPCQPFSYSGELRVATDERNGWPWTIKAIDRFKPRWFVGENVRGLLCHLGSQCPDASTCPRCYFDGVILKQLRARFAFVGFFLLDAADFGIPQFRRRVFVWAGPAPVAAPVATHSDPASIKQSRMFAPSLQPWTTTASALGCRVWKIDNNDTDKPTSMDRKTVEVSNRPSVTVAATYSFRSGGHMHCRDGGERIPLTVQQLATLQDFPTGYPFVGSQSSKQRQIGNAVPPKLAEVVGRQVLDADARLAVTV